MKENHLYLLLQQKNMLAKIADAISPIKNVITFPPVWLSFMNSLQF